MISFLFSLRGESCGSPLVAHAHCKVCVKNCKRECAYLFTVDSQGQSLSKSFLLIIVIIITTISTPAFTFCYIPVNVNHFLFVTHLNSIIQLPHGCVHKVNPFSNFEIHK